MQEEYKDIAGYEGLYQVSNYGRVLSLVNHKGNVRPAPKEIRQFNHARGYLYVNLHRDGTMKHFLVHRLVAIAFIPNPDNLPEVNHKDEDKTSNVVSNLEWCSKVYNLAYGTGRKRSSSTRRLNSTVHGLSMDDPYTYSKIYANRKFTNGVEVITYNALKIRVRFGKTTYDQWHQVESIS